MYSDTTKVYTVVQQEEFLPHSSKDLQFHLELELLSIQSFTCSPHFHIDFLWALWIHLPENMPFGQHWIAPRCEWECVMPVIRILQILLMYLVIFFKCSFLPTPKICTPKIHAFQRLILSSVDSFTVHFYLLPSSIIKSVLCSSQDSSLQYFHIEHT